MPELTEFWGIPQPWGPILVYLIVSLSFFIMLGRFGLEASRWWRLGLPEKRWNQPFKRLLRVVTYGIGQARIFTQKYPGIMHAGLAWSFIVFFIATTMSAIHGHVFRFLEGNIYLGYKLILDLFTVFFLVGASMAGYRRYVKKPERLTQQPRFTFSLVFLILIVLNGLVVESLRLAAQQPVWGIWSPAGWALARLWLALGASQQGLVGWHLAMHTIHYLTVSVFFVTLPTGTLVHVLTGPMNIYFSKLDNSLGALPVQKVNQKEEPVFTSRLQDLTWKQILDGEACTECGRCQDACPAYSSNQVLSPKRLIVELRNYVDGTIYDRSAGKILAGEVIQDEELWACTTCGACVKECPVLIEHVDTIVDLRRYLVNEGRVEARLQDALANLGRYGNSFGLAERARTKWAQSIQPMIPDARRQSVEYLWFTGDYASYNSALAEITQKTAVVLQKAGINFGLMYEGERNSGNDIRRVGEEGLFEILMEKNCAGLSRCDFKAIFTTDPHSYNTLKNEYPQDVLQGRPVFHIAEILDRLISEGKIHLSTSLGYSVTFHDPCYLGRYNGIFDAPRRVIRATGCKISEMPRNRERAYCCAAGGGRIWMEEKEIHERPAENRVREAAALAGVEYFVVTCPKDVIMYRDAVKTMHLEDRMIVKDLVELVYEGMGL